MTGAFSFRADDATRTRDIHLGKVVLYQLSYVRKLCTAGAMRASLYPIH